MFFDAPGMPGELERWAGKLRVEYPEAICNLITESD